MKKERKQKLYEEQNGKCFFCDREFPIEVFTFDHLLPRSLSGDDSANNLVLSCAECNARRGNKMPFREIELIYFLTQLLDKHPDYRNISQEALLSKDVRYRADIIAEHKENGKWRKVLIELKSTPTFTSRRLEEVVHQLNNYKSVLKEDVKLVLSFPGILSQSDNEYLKKSKIEVWDRDFITQTFKNEIEQIEDKLFLKLFSFSIVKSKVHDTLIADLKLIPPGRADWSKYQKHVEKVLSYLFSDVLSDPITELSDKYGINRRDFILRNYCETGFWKYLREKYQADFIVIDAKNYTGKIKKNQILQLSNYLKTHGTGLFAIIISRNGEEDKGSYFTRREVWATERKMIIILDDNDLEKMVLAKASSNQPEEIIIQKIEGFRLEM
ncbi:HNH endonuclease domain-containing protein [Tenacibaculum tangerinum]|uniref:HNH endonuclease domain-containing protein n=1 Tax=Tenacibaculum tangerinum TaxID=3038772 RepID=A0ABY8L7P1_9FLAO|nr:HNH endonuclease [Tenacibaculum tangerinum]WGH76652.1 HNH endonuclease domain-containing protein [Tenacibaculum tangerinum]